MSFLGELMGELKRRNVVRAAVAYVAVAWLVIQVAETVFPAFGLGDRALRNLILVLAAGLVPAVALSWVFELTPDGLRRDRDIEPGGELSRRTNRLLDRLIVLLLTLGISYFAIDKFLLDPARDARLVEEAAQRARSEVLTGSYGDQSIAVLPFVNLSADPEQEYFGDGMAEEVLNLLARIPELRVISRSSAFTYKGSDLKLDAIATELGVAHILEGSVRRAGNRIRITAQLIEARSDSHLWSRTWDRELDDIFAIQDEIAAEVVSNLKLRILGEVPRALRVDARSYLLFMRARQLLDAGTDVDYQQIDDLLKAAIDGDPAYAEPWTGLNWLRYRCYAITSRNEAAPYCATRSPDEWLALADEASQRALALDPDNPTANAYSAYNLAFQRRDFQAAADRFRRAVEAAPPVSDIVRTTSIFARHILRPDLAIRLGEYGVARDPRCQLCRYHLGVACLEAGRYDRARELFEEFVRLGRGGWFSLGEAHLLGGDAEGALAAFERQVQPDGRAGGVADEQRARYLARVALALHALGRTDEFAATLAKLETGYGETQADEIAEVHAWIGDLATASQWLDRTLARPLLAGEWVPFNHVSPFLQPLLAQPRWQAYLAERGLSRDQLARIDFDFALPGE